ncbi:ROK family transcriptional regulator [Atrimonas thermophila]|uniref:ROK family transcriptional regulator n=1 Tax=Atrimonas thermophila TaxID=3064161 RepID=UPI00399D450C
MVVGTPEGCRKVNRKNILLEIRNSAPISRTELSKRVGLSLPSVSRIIGPLIEEGIVQETGKGTSSLGRKPTLLEINPEYRYVFGVDCSRQITVILSDLHLRALDEREVEASPSLGPHKIAHLILEVVEEICQLHSLSPDQIAGIGIATPGFCFKHSEKIEESPFSGWESTDVVQLFSELIPYRLVIDNIARASTLAEMSLGWGKEFSSFFYFFCSWGVGGGYVYNGELVRGEQGSCGEVGHTTVDPQGMVCYCGNRGCLEQYTSTAFILNALKQETGQYLTFSELLARYQRRDLTVLTLLGRAGFMLGKGIANVINLLNPAAVVLGGELAQFSEYVEEAICSARENIFSLRAQNTPILVSRLQERGSALGVASEVVTSLLEDLT